MSVNWERDYGDRVKRNESIIGGVFVIASLMWIPLLIWALVRK